MNIKMLLAGRAGGLKPSSIRALNPLMRLPGMISMGGGYPNAQTFAIASLDGSLPDRNPPIDVLLSIQY